MKTMNCPVTKFIDSKMQRFDPLWQAQNGVGGLRSRYYDKTGVAKYREWRGLHDTMVAHGSKTSCPWLPWSPPRRSRA